MSATAGRDDGPMAPGNDSPLPVALVGDGDTVPCVRGGDRPYLNLDAAASTSALPSVAARVAEFLPGYSSVHRGAGFRSRMATVAYEQARSSALAFAGRPEGDDVAIMCRNTTEAINHLAYRLRPTGRRGGDDGDRAPRQPVAVGAALRTPLRRMWCRRHLRPRRRRRRARPPPDTPAPGHHRRVERDGMAAATRRDHRRRARARCARACRRSTARTTRPCRSRRTSWRGAATRCTRRSAPACWSGPRATFAEGDPFLAGGGAVDLVDLDEVIWTEPPDREEAGSPNVIGAVALRRRDRELTRLGWNAVREHDDQLARALRRGLAGVPGVRLLGPDLADARRCRWRPSPSTASPRAGRGAPERRVRHRRAPRLLLRAPLPAASARSLPARSWPIARR